MFISDLKPGTDYDIVVEARAKHQNQRDAWDPHDPYLCKEQGPITTFRTGHPPMSPTEFTVIGGTTKSLKLAWNEPIIRGVKILKYLLVVSGPGYQAFDMTNTLDSVLSSSSGKYVSGLRKILLYLLLLFIFSASQIRRKYCFDTICFSLRFNFHIITKEKYF